MVSFHCRKIKALQKLKETEPLKLKQSEMSSNKFSYSIKEDGFIKEESCFKSEIGEIDNDVKQKPKEKQLSQNVRFNAVKNVNIHVKNKSVSIFARLGKKNEESISDIKVSFKNNCKHNNIFKLNPVIKPEKRNSSNQTYANNKSVTFSHHNEIMEVESLSKDHQKLSALCDRSKSTISDFDKRKSSGAEKVRSKIRSKKSKFKTSTLKSDYVLEFAASKKKLSSNVFDRLG